MSRDNLNQVVVVTGASRGLGLGCVEDLLERGYRVIATARDPSGIRAKISAKDIPTSQLVTFPLDVTIEDSLRNFETFLSTDIGQCHALVNNAGVYVEEELSALQTPGDNFLRTLLTNVYGPYRMSQIVIPLMKKQSFGRIVNVSSQMETQKEFEQGFPAYRISKITLNSLSRYLGESLRGTGILVNSVCPGSVKTDMGGPNAEREVEAGVASILWAVNLPPDGPTGGFYRDGEELPNLNSWLLLEALRK